MDLTIVNEASDEELCHNLWKLIYMKSLIDVLHLIFKYFYIPLYLNCMLLDYFVFC